MYAAVLLLVGLGGVLGQIAPIPEAPNRVLSPFVRAHFVKTTDDRIYVTDRFAHEIYVFDNDLEQINTFGNIAMFDEPSGIEVLGKFLYIADVNNGRIVVTDLDGNLVRTFSSLGSGGEHLNGPRDLTVGSDGNLYVTDCMNNRTAVFSTDGKYLREFGTGVFHPTGIAFGTDGRLHVSYKPFDQIHIFDAESGKLLEVKEGIPRPKQIKIDDQGYVYVAATEKNGQGSVRIYDEVNYNHLKTVQGFNSKNTFGVGRSKTGMLLVTDGTEKHLYGYEMKLDDLKTRKAYRKNGPGH